MNPKQKGERGAGKLNLIVTLVIVGGLIFAAVKVVPVFINNYEFQDALQSEAKFALTGFPRKSPDDIRDDIYKKAQELGIPIGRDAILLNIDASDGQVDITVDYNVTFDLAIWQLPHDFHDHADNHTI